MSFVHLSVHSEYSLHDSVIRLKPLMKSVAAAGMPAVAIAEDSNMFSAIKAYKGAMAVGVKPIIGSHLQVSSTRLSGTEITVLCKNNDGYLALTEIVSRGYGEAPRDAINRPIIPLQWFKGKSEGLVVLSGAKNGEIGRLLLNSRAAQAKEALADFKTLFGQNFYLELQRIGHASDDRCVRESVMLALETGTPVVATNPVRFTTPDEFSTHEIRLAISEGRQVQKLREDITPSCTQHQYLKSPAEMQELFSDIPQALENTVRIAAQCSVDLNLGKNFLPSFEVPGKTTEAEFLKEQAFEGLEERLRYYFKTDEAIAKHRQEYEDRLRFELDTINEMGFPGYFLIVSDFISWAKRNDIPVGPGRGSGAGSLVAYSLGITDINPLPYDLLFERFLNPERVSMPDFDVDFCMDKRDLVIKYVADRYGHGAVSQIITFGTMAAKGVIRDVCRALGQSQGFANNLAKMIPKSPEATLTIALEQVPELKSAYETDGEVRQVMEQALALEGLTRQVGKHAGGVVIAPIKLTNYTPTYSDADGSGLVSQYDKDDVETAGLVKFDFLGLRTLTIVDHAVKAANVSRAKKGESALDIHDIPLDDKKTFELLQSCETTGVFQLESDGMKQLCKRLHLSNIEELIALLALFRPGPLQSGMVDDFIDCKHGRKEVSYPHPLLKPVLEKTYGVMVYQEQVMQSAQVLAGYTLGEADMLRRAMGKKKPEEMVKQRDGFIKGAMKHNGIEPELAGTIFDLIEKFAGYGFNKSHSAAYAFISYQTAYLKANYPAEFMAAVISSDMGDTDKTVRFINEARKMGLTINPPCVNKSQWLFSAHDNEIVYGIGAVKGIGEGPARQIIENRKQPNGSVSNYYDLEDFLYRNHLNKRVIEASINAGMHDYIGIDRGQLMADYPFAQKAGKQLRTQGDQLGLFGLEQLSVSSATGGKVPPMEVDVKLAGERKVLGLYLTGHPFARHRHAIKPSLSADLATILTVNEDETIDQFDKFYNVTIAGLITDIDVKNNTKGNYAFFKLDDGTARLNCSTFTKTYHEYQAFIKDDNLVVLKGSVRTNYKSGEISLIVDSVQLLSNFLENQTGRAVITLPEGSNLFREMAKVHSLGSLEDEGTLRVVMQVKGKDDAVELPIPPISAQGPAMERLKKLWGEHLAVEYIKSTPQPKTTKSGIAVEPLEGLELDSKRSELRLQLESFLMQAERAMHGSKEEGMTHEL